MNNSFITQLHELFGVKPEITEFCAEVLKGLENRFKEIDDIAQYNQNKVLHVMQAARLSEAHFHKTTGYGYNDIGRDTLETVFAGIFKAESALVRPQLVSGTHALTAALFGQLRHGDDLLLPWGLPYDTLQGVIGIRPATSSLAEHGVTHRIVDILPDGSVDFPGIKAAIGPNTKMALIQRSKGYTFRKTLTNREVGEIISAIKAQKDDVICLVDNCYGEFTDTVEPIEMGADLVAGSLIKNLGGGLAPVGGYVAGKHNLVERAAYHLTAPGVGKEVGPGLGVIHTMFQGLFQSPAVVAAALKTAAFAGAVFRKLGFETAPAEGEPGDIVMAIKMNSPERVLSFCKGIQKAAPVDSFVTPLPWEMPGYDCDVVMAAGAFISGASIELSADAPMREPYYVFFQGALTWQHGFTGVILAFNQMVTDGLINIV